jgi:hypothetical protein
MSECWASHLRCALSFRCAYAPWAGHSAANCSGWLGLRERLRRIQHGSTVAFGPEGPTGLNVCPKAPLRALPRTLWTAQTRAFVKKRWPERGFTLRSHRRSRRFKSVTSTKKPRSDRISYQGLGRSYPRRDSMCSVRRRRRARGLRAVGTGALAALPLGVGLVFWRCWWLEIRNSPDIARRFRPIEVVIIRSYGTRNWQEKCLASGRTAQRVSVQNANDICVGNGELHEHHFRWLNRQIFVWSAGASRTR